MKKIILTDKKLNEIKQKHLDYCKKHVKWKKLGLSEDDSRKLFIENPFNENMNLKRGYDKFILKNQQLPFLDGFGSL